MLCLTTQSDDQSLSYPRPTWVLKCKDWVRVYYNKVQGVKLLVTGSHCVCNFSVNLEL